MPGLQLYNYNSVTDNLISGALQLMKRASLTCDKIAIWIIKFDYHFHSFSLAKIILNPSVFAVCQFALIIKLII